MIQLDEHDLELLLRASAAVQMVVALLNLALPRMLGWKDDLQRMPLLMRQVFHVHAWFISLTLAILAVITWRFAREMSAGASQPLAWLAAAIAIFWGLRSVRQVAYYSASHWRGRTGPTAVHVALLIVYPAMSVIYTLAALEFATE